MCVCVCDRVMQREQGRVETCKSVGAVRQFFFRALGNVVWLDDVMSGGGLSGVCVYFEYIFKILYDTVRLLAFGEQMWSEAISLSAARALLGSVSLQFQS